MGQERPERTRMKLDDSKGTEPVRISFRFSYRVAALVLQNFPTSIYQRAARTSRIWCDNVLLSAPRRFASVRCRKYQRTDSSARNSWILYRGTTIPGTQKGIKRNKIKCKRALPGGVWFYFRLNSEATGRHPSCTSAPSPPVASTTGPYLVSESKVFSPL